MESRESSYDISEIETTNNAVYTLAGNFILSSRIYKIFSHLLSFTTFSSTGFMLAFCVFLAYLTFPMFRFPGV